MVGILNLIEMPLRSNLQKKKINLSRPGHGSNVLSSISPSLG